MSYSRAYHCHVFYCFNFKPSLQVVRLRAGLHSAEPSLRALGNIGRRHQQRGDEAGGGVPAENDIRQRVRGRTKLRHILPEHSGHALLPEPSEAEVLAEVPFIRLVVQAARERGEAAELHCGGAAVHGH